MAPKAAAAPPPPVDLGPPEEEEEGEGRVAFRLGASNVADLPCELETFVSLSGLCREIKSSPAPASAAPAEFQFPKDKFIRRLGQELNDDVVARPLIVSLRDAASDGAIIGKASLSCIPLLHDATEVCVTLELKLTEAYNIKWFPELEQAQAEASSKKAAAKGKAAPAPGKKDEEEAEKVVRPPGWVPPPTTIKVTVRVDQLVGPDEDRGDWTTLGLRIAGAYALPDRLTGVGLAAPPADDPEAHQLRYRAVLLGEPLGEGALARALEEAPADTGADEELSQAAWRERQERCARSIRFNGDAVAKYRGAKFMKDFRYMLNYVGGVWVYFTPEERPATDPKKPNAPDAGALARHFVGRAWLDLRALVKRGTRSVEACCQLVNCAAPQDVMAGEPKFQDTGAFVKVSLQVSRDMCPAPAPPVQDLLSLAPSPAKAINKFPASADAITMYKEAVERSFSVLVRDCGGPNGPSSVPAAVARLKKAGVYDEVQEGMRGAVVRVFRERLRKDVGAVPGRPLQGEPRDEVIARAYTYLKGVAVNVLDDIRAREPSGLDASGEAPSRRSSVPSKDGGSANGGEPPEGAQCSAVGSTAAAGLGGGPALEETPRTLRAREALSSATHVSGRYARLAFEAELVGDWDRAASCLQSRLLLEEVRSDPKEWVAYAKFCARARGRQAAAEEALRQAVQLLAAGAGGGGGEVALEVDLMLACLLLDRDRHEEAIRVFKELHDKDIADPTSNFLLGLALFLAGDDGPAPRALLQSVGKPRAWFQGLRNDAQVAEKLSAFKLVDGPLPIPPYQACLEKLLDFGLPSLAFTFLDQCGILPQEALAQEPLALIDARASALDRDFAAAAARLEALVSAAGEDGASGGGVSREAWRLQGECLFQLGDMDRALQALNQALSFEKKFEEPAVYIRLGAVSVAKKRWKHAREAFLKSIQFLPTAEAWGGIAFAEYRSEELQMCYEALCEASLLDNERADVWAMLTLVHLRCENWRQADHSFRQCIELKADCEELLLEVAAEYAKASASGRLATYAEVAAEYARAAAEGRPVALAEAAAAVAA